MGDVVSLNSLSLMTRTMCLCQVVSWCLCVCMIAGLCPAVCGGLGGACFPHWRKRGVCGADCTCPLVGKLHVCAADRALNILNYTKIKGRPCRIMYSQRDPTLRRRNAGNIVIKNLSDKLDHKGLNDFFSAFGNILSCKVAVDSEGKSKGYGFVHFEKQESADQAIEMMNGEDIEGSVVTIEPFKSKVERIRQSEQNFTNVYVKNLPLDVDTPKLQEMFGLWSMAVLLFLLPSSSCRVPS